MTADQWRQNEAEARQEMPQYKCVSCGLIVDGCDVNQCDICHEYYCHYCFQSVDDMCPDCKETYESEAKE